MWHCRARSALAAAAANGTSGKGDLLRVAEADARRIARENMAWATPYATLVRAGIARVRGDGDERVVAHLRAAIGEFEASEMKLHAMAAKDCLGRVARGDEASAARAEVEAWMRSQGVAEPARVVAMLAPGLA
jgi:hypothetical protein